MSGYSGTTSAIASSSTCAEAYERSRSSRSGELQSEDRAERARRAPSKGGRGSRRLLARTGGTARLVPTSATGRRLVLRRGRLPHQLVRRRAAEPIRQLPRPASRKAWRQDRSHLRGGRAGARSPLHLSRAV